MLPLFFLIHRLQFPMFGVSSNVKRSRSSDTPPKVANHSPPSHLNPFDCDPINEKENMDDNLFWAEFDSGGCHDNDMVRQLPPIQHVCCHGNTIRKDQRPKGIRRNVELFNSPYMGDNKGLPHEVMNSNKKRKVSPKVTTPRKGNKVGYFDNMLIMSYLPWHLSRSKGSAMI